MTNLTNDTLLTFTETKNGHATGRVFNSTVKGYINAVRNADHDRQIEEAFEHLRNNHFDEASRANYTIFDELPVADQLALCIARNNESFASHTTYKVTA